MTANPIDEIIVDGLPVAKGDLRDFSKTYERLRFGTVDEVRSRDLTGQFGGVYIDSLKSLFDLDTGDTTTEDNGTDTIIDAANNRFKRVVFSVVPTQLEITAAGNVVLDDDVEDIVLINKTVGEATEVEMPDAENRIKSVRIVDKRGDASTNPITIVGKSGTGQTIMGAASYVLDFSGGSIILSPYADASGWF